MKLLLTGDWHLTSKRPENRIDDYWNNCKSKIMFILQYAKENNIEFILQPGDFTDSPFMSWFDFSEIVNIINYNNINIFTCYGQHDLRYRTKGNTALDALFTSCNSIMLLDDRNQLIEEGIHIYSASYGMDIPEIKNKDKFNILIIHKMILQDKLWEGQTEYSDASNFLRTNNFDVVVSGDNHQGFIHHSKTLDRTLFNCGALMRNSVALVDHQPFIVIYDTDTRKYEKIMIPIEPPEKVFNLEKVTKEKEKNENLEAFVSGLSEHKEVGLKFEDNLNFYLNEIKAEQKIRDIIEEAKQ